MGLPLVAGENVLEFKTTIRVQCHVKLKTGKAFTQFVGGYGVTAVAFAFAACADSVSLQKHFNDAMKTLYAAIAVLSFFTDGLSTTHIAGIMSSTHIMICRHIADDLA